MADGDERLNWPSVTLHIPTSELGVMGEKWKEGRWKEREKERQGEGGRATKCHPNFLTSEVGIMEGRREATLRGDGLREVGWR